MVIMASGFARGRVRTTAATTTTESRNMAATLQITGWQRGMQPWFPVCFFGIGHPCYDQMTPVKTRYPLTSIMWPFCELKLRAHRGQVFFWSWPLTRCWFFDWITGSCLVAHPGLNVNGIITFSSMQMFFSAFLCIWWLLKLKTEGQTIYRKPQRKVTKLKSKFYFLA